MAVPDRTHGHRQWLSSALLWVGALLLAAWIVPSVYGRVLSHLEISRFQAGHAETISWAPGRVAAYRKALHVALPAPEAVLRIPSANLEAPVMEGGSELVLNRGVGHIQGTALPGAPGNMVLAGHRDGFFRRLKNVSVGDRIEVARAGGTDVYRVDSLRVTGREDRSMLRGTPQPTLTLITCYPFFFIGPAPQRFVVQASLVSAQPSHLNLQ